MDVSAVQLVLRWPFVWLLPFDLHKLCFFIALLKDKEKDIIIMPVIIRAVLLSWFFADPTCVEHWLSWKCPMRTPPSTCENPILESKKRQLDNGRPYCRHQTKSGAVFIILTINLRWRATELRNSHSGQRSKQQTNTQAHSGAFYFTPGLPVTWSMRRNETRGSKHKSILTSV